jgi:hypothetical protein
MKKIQIIKFLFLLIFLIQVNECISSEIDTNTKVRFYFRNGELKGYSMPENLSEDDINKYYLQVSQMCNAILDSLKYGQKYSKEDIESEYSQNPFFEDRFTFVSLVLKSFKEDYNQFISKSKINGYKFKNKKTKYLLDEYNKKFLIIETKFNFYLDIIDNYNKSNTYNEDTIIELHTSFNKIKEGDYKKLKDEDENGLITVFETVPQFIPQFEIWTPKILLEIKKYRIAVYLLNKKVIEGKYELKNHLTQNIIKNYINECREFEDVFNKVNKVLNYIKSKNEKIEVTKNLKETKGLNDTKKTNNLSVLKNAKVGDCIIYDPLDVYFIEKNFNIEEVDYSKAITEYNLNLYNISNFDSYEDYLKYRNLQSLNKKSWENIRVKKRKYKDCFYQVTLLSINQNGNCLIKFGKTYYTSENDILFEKAEELWVKSDILKLCE